MRDKTVERIIVGDIATNCWIYPCADTVTAGPTGIEIFGAGLTGSGYTGCALIDPGADAQRIMSRLETLKMIPLYILLTHGHFDHIAAVPSLVAENRTIKNSSTKDKPATPADSNTKAANTTPTATTTAVNKKYPLIAIHHSDSQYLGPGSYEAHCRCFTFITGNAAYIDAYWEDMPPADALLEEGSHIGPFTVLHLPGHTPGSIAFWDEKAKVLFTGDTLFKNNYGRTDLPGGNVDLLFGSLKRLFAMDSDIKVYPGHGPATTIGQESAMRLI